MKFSAGVCEFKDGKKYVGLYNFHYDIYARMPSTLGNSKRVAHFSYKKGGHKGGGDIFLLDETIKQIPDREIGLTKRIQVEEGKYHIKDLSIDRKKGNAVYAEENLKNAMEKYDIQFEVVRGLPKVVQNQAISFGKVDIVYFAQGLEAKNPRGPKIDYVKKIIPRTKIKRIEYNQKGMLDGGKHWFIPMCTKANNDEGEGCFASWIPEVGANFDGEYFTNYFWSPSSECDYCYSDDKHKLPPKTIYRFEKKDEKRFLKEINGDCCLEYNSKKKLGRPVDVLRFGKLVEPWMPGVSEESLKRKLELMIDKPAKGVITSKFIPYSKEFNNLLKRSGSLLFYSFGFDNVQEGPVLWGRTQEWLYEQFIKFNENGNNAIPYLMVHAHLPPGKREKRILDLGTRVQILTPRYKQNKGNRLVKEMTGQTWDFLKRDSQQNKKIIGQIPLPNFEEEELGRGSHILYNRELVCKEIHPDWKKIIVDNQGRVRMCHHDDEVTSCGGCFHKYGKIVNTIHVEKQRSQRYIRREKGSRKKPKDLGQKKLF